MADVTDATAVLDTEQAGPKAIRGSALRLTGYGATVALSVLGAALMTRHLGPGDFGRYTVVLSVITIAAGLSESGMINIGVREYAVRERHERDAMLAGLQGIRLTLAVIGSAAAVAFGVVAGYPDVMIGGLALTGVALILQTLQQTWQIPLQATLRLGWVTALDVLRQAATVALIVAAVVTGAGLTAFYALPLPVGIGLVALTVPLVRGIGPLRPSFDTARWRPLLKMIAPYAAATAVGSIYVYVAAVLLSLVSNAHEVGIFSVSFRVFIVLSGIGLLLVGAAFPIVARAARDDAQRLAYATQRLLEAMLVAGAWIGLLTVLCAPTAIDVIAGGGEFSESVHVLRIQGAAVLLGFLAVTAGHVLVSLHRSRALLTAASVGLVVSAGVTLSLADALGAGAGAWANVAGEGVIAVVNLVALTRGPQAIRLRFGVAWRVAAATGAAALPVLVGMPNVVLGIVATVVFFAVALALRAVPRELLDAIPRPAR